MAPLIAAAAVAVALSVAACGGDDTASRSEQPRQRTPVPPPVERYVHQTFHRLGRFCSRRRADDRRLDRTTNEFVRLYRRYPAPRYGMRIDDEAGTMLSAILVLRYELAQCSPRHAAAVDRVLPPNVRRALTPLR